MEVQRAPSQTGTSAETPEIFYWSHGSHYLRRTTSGQAEKNNATSKSNKLQGTRNVKLSGPPSTV